MKFEEKVVQSSIFKMKPIPIFYDKYFFRYKKKTLRNLYVNTPCNSVIIINDE